ncbi:MAG TPA: endopeptidase La, partial [Candidatus Obscuribacterales bacterium]|nr:endopeptidase La [Candidatus Obscuribacterales bacterium]
SNTLEYVPRPLHDRLEVIHISGYTEEEKVAIAEQHVIPKTLEKHGLTVKQLKFQDAALRKIIQEYTREAGVRALERCIATIARKVVTQIVKKRDASVKVTPNLVPTYLGPPKVVREGEVRGPQIGIVTGLAWTEIGGETLSVEVNIMPGKGKLQLTGQLGDVMKESAHAAFSYIRSHAAKLNINANFHDEIDIHVHIPEGAIPKDGPSAGIALATALLSAVSKRAVRSSIAMTGEITLRGRVLPIGGLKEKVLAALRQGIKTVLYPKGNEKDLSEIPDYVQKRIELVPVGHLDEVFKIAFTDNSKNPPQGKSRGVQRVVAKRGARRSAQSKRK